MDNVLTQMPLLIDGALIILLVVAIFACFIVYRRLEAVRKGQSEMALLVEDLNRAVGDAQTGIQTLKYTATEVESGLGSSIKEARSLRDELSIISEAANNLADRIERGVSESRARDAGTGSELDGSGSSKTADPDKPSQAPSGKKQKDLMSALKEAR